MNKPLMTACRVLALTLALSVTSSALAERVSTNGITYQSGGIGEEEQEKLRTEAPDFNLHMTFAEKISGAYLTDIAVTIRNNAGATVLATTSEGPWFFARLPEGRYRITVGLAAAAGEEQTRVLQISRGKTAKLHFYWPGKASQ